MNGLPAAAGGKPAFKELLSIVRPSLPDFDRFSLGLKEIFSSRMLTNSKYVRMFEDAVASRLGVKHAVATNGCQSSLMLLLKGLGLEGEVIVPSFTFMATVSAIAWAGCKPVFADVTEDGMTIDPASVAKNICSRTVAVIGVHLFGKPAPVEELEAIARKNGLRLFYDSAHAIGARYKGKSVGVFGDAETFSLSPTKLVTSAEGGLITTNSDEIAKTVRTGRNYGNPGNYDCEFPGLNARMSELHAVLGLLNLENLDKGIANRHRVAELFRKKLENLPGLHFQELGDEELSSLKDFTIIVDEDSFGMSRGLLGKALRAENIDSRFYFSPACHQMNAFRRFLPQGKELPVTEKLEKRCISLPIWSEMSTETAERIAAAIERIHQHADAVMSGLKNLE